MKLLLEEHSRSEIRDKAEQERLRKAKSVRIRIVEPSSLMKSTVEYNFIENDELIVFATATDNHSGSGKEHKVQISFKGIIKELIRLAERDSRHYVTRDTVRSAVSRAYGNDTKLHYRCDCEDFKYTFHYYSSESNSILGNREDRRPKVRNPDNDKGCTCKHILALTMDKENLRGAAVTQVLKYIEENYDAVLDIYNLDKNEFIYKNRRR